MAKLPKDPKGWELEDFISAHFASRGFYIETGIKERNPDEILELDIVRTDYRNAPQTQYPVEAKSGDWGLGDVFKFYGWTRYLGLEPGEFIHKEQCGRLDPESIKHIEERTHIRFVHLPTVDDAEARLQTVGFPEPPWATLPELWQFSFWAQRRLLHALNQAIKKGVCPHTAKAAKQYYQLINDAVFFTPDVRDRINKLFLAHFGHQALGASAAYELETGSMELQDPPLTNTFKQAAYRGKHFPIQTCLYLAHRARLYILKAVVDYWLAQQRGEYEKDTIVYGPHRIDSSSGRLTAAIAAAIDELSAAHSFRMFPVFWQVFLWSWGGFILDDRADEEYTLLAKETGVPKGEIPVALRAFDLLFPTSGGWFRKPGNDSRRIITLMPAAIRGIGAFRRLELAQKQNYTDLGFTDSTASRLGEDHNTTVRLLDCNDAALPE